MNAVFTIIASALKIIGILMETAQNSQWYRAGQDAEAAREAAKIAAKSEYGRKALAEFNAMPESSVDDFLRSLEPGRGG